VLVDEAKMVRFRNALHEGYSDLNIFERTFAEALDRTRRVWLPRSNSGMENPPCEGLRHTFRPASSLIRWSPFGSIAMT
jgi:hypothetical protein